MAKVLKTSPEGRRCTFPNCERLLSIYNHNTYCRVHQELTRQQEQAKPHRHN